MKYDYRTIVDDAESIARTKLYGMPREDILSYEVGVLRAVIQTLCSLLENEEKITAKQNEMIELFKGKQND
jgi:hypothetical protein